MSAARTRASTGVSCIVMRVLSSILRSCQTRRQKHWRPYIAAACLRRAFPLYYGLPLKRWSRWLKVIGDVAGDDALSFLGAEVVGRKVVGVFETDFEAEENGAADPVAVADKVLGVLGLVACALALYVVDEFVADGKV